MPNTVVNKEVNKVNKFSKQADISVMRIAATLAVIFLHTCNTISNNAENYNLSDTQMLFLTSGNYLMNWAVPMFLMITGALFLKEERIITFRSCLTKYSKRILLALLIFGIPFSLLEIIVNTRQIKMSIIGHAILNVLTGDSWSHLWYLYALLGIYLVLPVLKAFVDKASRKDIEAFLGILLLFNILLPIVNNLFRIKIAFYIPISSFLVFYVLLGKYMYDKTPGILKYKKICVGILAIAFAVLIIINRYTVPHGDTWLDYHSPLIVIITTVMFALFKNIAINKMDRLWRIDRLCFGVYLVHPVFINFFYKGLKITPLNANKYYLLAIFLFWIVFVVCSFLTSWIMSLIKPLKKYVL